MNNKKTINVELVVRMVVPALVLVILAGCTSMRGVSPVKTQAVETYVKGVYAYQAGNQDEAVDTLKEAIATNPQLIMPRVMLGGIYKQKGNYQAAAEQFETLTQLDRYEPSNHYNLGVSYQMLQRLREAAKSYQEALRLSPNNFGANMNLGLVYLALGDVDNAVKFTEKAAKIKPQSAEAQANLAVALDNRGDYPQAELAYRKAIELAPPTVGVLENYGNNLYAQQKWREALQAFGDAKKLQDKPYHHKRMGDALALGEKYDEALTEYHLALQKNPKYYGALNASARVMMLQYQAGMELDEKKRDGAIALWKQSLEINPNQAEVKVSLEQWEKRMFSK